MGPSEYFRAAITPELENAPPKRAIYTVPLCANLDSWASYMTLRCVHAELPLALPKVHAWSTYLQLPDASKPG